MRTPLWESGPRASWIRVARVNSCVEGVPGLATEGVIKTPTVLQEDAELRKAATAVLLGALEFCKLDRQRRAARASLRG